MFIRMGIKHLIAALALGMVVSSGVAEDGKTLAPTPPMGWNSWDSYGLTVTEAQFRENMTVLAAQLKEFGWQYVVVDEGWYLQNPENASMPEALRYTVNLRGQYEPATNRFPSSVNGGGFKPLSDAAHDEGLKFGIHIIRGIPKKTVLANTRIGRTKYRASFAADTTDVCPWNPDNFGVKANAAGQAWYDALMKQYAAWGVDYLKVDCIASHPYKGAEIRMIHKAIERSGRSMVLSLSPGPTSLGNVDEVAKNAQLWRISNDVWDHWDTEKGQEWSQSVKGQFPVIASWSRFVGPGSWPDADMLPIGQLRPVPGEGKPRASRLTADEQRTMITLWAIARSPLFIGGNLTQMDDAMKSMLTNPAVIEMDQHSVESGQADQTGDVVVWTSKSSEGTPKKYLAVFNLGDAPLHIDKTYAEYGFVDRAQYRVRDLWQRKELGVQSSLTVDLPPHGSIVLSLRE
ncbi:glycoside hydrolase family 27 protein [Tunturiibacter lichenicola]|uniref:glycoside hydrolase family 27 protein n=1 Tax=Tunturiibacter lichenicola TaxID=2051959 RepID=UPI0021B466F6|nr:glycoside hydrolase family 27 protein [Edaphobacter lichenicola]